MKSSFYFLLCSLVILLILLSSGCELITDEPDQKRTFPYGTDLVINELYTLSPDKYYAFTWIELFNPTKKPIDWFSVAFPSEGFAVGSSGVAVQTFLDGQTWAVLNPGSSNETFHSVTYPHADTGYYAGYDGTKGIIKRVYRDNAGSLVSENLPSPTTRSINSINFLLQSKTGFLVGDRGVVMRSINRGINWTQQTGVQTTQNLHSLFQVDFANHIWACGDSGTVIRRISASLWEKQTIPITFASTVFRGVHFADDTGWVVGDNGTILRSGNGGTSWSAQTTGAPVTLRSVFSGYSTTTAFFFMQGRVWVCGDNGTIWRTDNNGVNWYPQNSTTTAQLNAIQFVDSLKGWAFGNNGTILNTTNGGEQWQSQTSNTSENLFASAFIFPPRSAVLSYYQLTMLAQKRHFFVDPVSGIVNFDFIVKTDTGIVNFLIRGDNSVPYQGFTIVNNDSTKFKDHFKLGPGSADIINYSIAYDTVIFSGAPQFIEPRNPILWSLLSSGEIRLEKRSGRFSFATGQVLGVETKVLDMIRYGNYRPSPDPFPNNEPLDFLPDGWSIARFANDAGNLPENQQSTIKSFYMTKDPIPGWFSQESKP